MHIQNQLPLRTIYDILSVTNSTLLTADIILWCTKILFQTDGFHFLFHKKKYNLLFLPSPLVSHLTSCAPTKSNSYFANSLATVVSKADLHRLPAFHTPGLIPLFHWLGRTKGPVQAQGTGKRFATRSIFMVRSC